MLSLNCTLKNTEIFTLKAQVVFCNLSGPNGALHMGQDNPKNRYRIEDEGVESNHEEKDLRVV